jgi:hypothetical protein
LEGEVDRDCVKRKTKVIRDPVQHLGLQQRMHVGVYALYVAPDPARNLP